MDNGTAWAIILGLSLIIGAIKCEAAKGRKGILNELNELLNHIVGIFVGGAIVYFFITIRLPLFEVGNDVHTTDLVLLLVALLAFFGWLPYVPGQLKNAMVTLFSKK